MSARRCSLCGINYPDRLDLVRCPVHGELTQLYSALEPDELWDWQATALKLQIEEQEQDEAELPILDLQPAPLRSGLYTLDVDAVSRKGVRLAVDDVFMVVPDASYLEFVKPCDCYWEVFGLSPGGKQWLVRPLKVPHTPDGD